ncbi:hypothetical protein AB0N17_03660 [Streptomyces sp. NPDC051133]|uniref:hypothetical protein n=1 Tax=Streptomyces sp. NPDC051133 TaxID=3155521 RepID=UPI00341B710C
MSGARHFFARGTVPDKQLKAEVKADIKSARGAQRDLAATGQHGAADRMGAAVDEHLDELNAVNNGTWTPKHA